MWDLAVEAHSAPIDHTTHVAKLYKFVFVKCFCKAVGCHFTRGDVGYANDPFSNKITNTVIFNVYMTSIS